MDNLVPKEELIAGKIYLIRNQKVMLDSDLAELYDVETKVLKRAVRRNIDRFPEDFMFELTSEEYNSLRSHFGTLKRGAHSKYPTMAFTEQGVAMLSGILRSQVAIQVNIQIMRVFVKMRKLITNYEELLQKIEALESNALEQNEQIINIYEIIKELIEPTYKNRKPIGYRINERREKYLAKHKRNN
ncbi:MAG: ORF6N domain-containing protein [Bacteroidales bacterium]|nr:ORF6N domain-containing protein [Bacteroidales bacterium]